MATFTTIPDTDLDGSSPATEDVFLALRNNPVAIAEGDASAPRIEIKALNTGSLSVDGSVTILAVSSYLLPAGIYLIVGVTQVVLEVFVSGAWRSSASTEISGIVVADGSTVRLYNPGGSARTMYWRKTA